MKKENYKSTEELETIGLVICEFDDTCDVCYDPKGGTFASGYTNDMCGGEVDYYICRKCATETYTERKEYLES